MAGLVLPFGEALDVVRSLGPLPRQITGISCQGDTIFVRVNMESSLPGLLRAVSPEITLALRYRAFQGGEVIFDLDTRVFSLSATHLVRLLLRLVSRLDIRGVKLESPEGPNALPRVRIAVQEILDEKLEGVKIENLVLNESALVVTARVERFRLLEAEEVKASP
jgi:hypothetical protein